MVQLLPESPYSQGGNPVSPPADTWRSGKEAKPMSREEHAQRMKDLNMKRGMMRSPRRGWSMTDYQGDDDVSQQASHSGAQVIDRQAAIPENEALQGPVPTTPNEATESSTPSPLNEQIVQLPQRPKLPPPRRSYSVMDYEPVPPGQPKPSSRLGLLDLPSELHFTLFDFLDPIDGTCLGLAHSSLYAIHRRMNGRVPLSSRYSGPNDMEWAWRRAGSLVRPVPQASIKEKELEQLRVKGQVYCRKCGISRCELHRHLKDWMGEGREYCEIKEVYGKPAGPDAKAYCFMSSPKNPHRCGRHGGRKLVEPTK